MKLSHILLASALVGAASLAACGHHVDIGVEGEQTTKGAVRVKIDPANSQPRNAQAEIPSVYQGQTYSYEFRDADGNRISGGDGPVDGQGETQISVPIPKGAASLHMTLEAPSGQSQQLTAGVGAPLTRATLFDTSRELYDVWEFPVGETATTEMAFMTVVATTPIGAINAAAEIADTAGEVEPPAHLVDLYWLVQIDPTAQGVIVRTHDTEAFLTYQVRLNNWVDTWSADGTSQPSATAVYDLNGWSTAATVVPLSEVNLAPFGTSYNTVLAQTDDAYIYGTLESTPAL